MQTRELDLDIPAGDKTFSHVRKFFPDHVISGRAIAMLTVAKENNHRQRVECWEKDAEYS